MFIKQRKIYKFFLLVMIILSTTYTGGGCFYSNKIEPCEEHQFIEKTILRETCTEQGEIEYVCSICGYSYSETTEALGHQFVCNNYNSDFFSNVTCKRCNLKYESKEQKNYTGEIDNNSKFLAIGFDDFRDSDFSLIIPLFNEYGARATFNRIAYGSGLSEEDKEKIERVLLSGHELGDHTFYHVNFIYEDPLLNGQNPNTAEGNQKPFPTNDDMRKEAHEDKNVFGLDLKESCSESMPVLGITTKWKDLTDEECNRVREFYSIYCDKSGILTLLDELSNTYLGTEGSSFGSWNDVKKCYDGGIFSGCKTSQNHEIWERVLMLTQLYYINNCDVQFQTWSYPGNYHSPFFYHDGSFSYYDENKTKLQNYTAKFESTLFSGENGERKFRSWNDCLREFGYVIVHDNNYPSRVDGTDKTMMSQQFIFNASLSRKDAVLYRTNSTVHYTDIAYEYPEEFFDGIPEEDYFKKMYEKKGHFYNFIEALRKDSSNGLIHGEIIDSINTFSEYMFFKAVLEYCKYAGIKVITKAEAYDICFNRRIEQGNLIHNTEFINSAQGFMTSSEEVPAAPDGYEGECCAQESQGERVLVVNGEASYIQYGIPYGNLSFSFFTKGAGDVKIYAIKNRDSLNADNNDLELISLLDINDSDYELKNVVFKITAAEETDYEQRWEGLGDKVMGIKIVYQGNIEVKNLELIKTSE